MQSLLLASGERGKKITGSKLEQSTDEPLSTSVDPPASVESHWPDKMRASFLLLLCVVLLATAAFANEA
ncbi:hypothetical protein LSAT2_012229, partial [Lamellibrachia satsuma]